MTITLLNIFRRRDGMTHDEFVEYYERSHRVIGEKVLSGYATRYVRRFLTPVGGDDDGTERDVVMEIDFPNEEVMNAFFASIRDDAEVAEEIRIDEDKLFDRATMKVYYVDERESALPAVGRERAC
ncbi:MAG TPA: EthD domain-containing protein [Croceicoccus sp.]|nr:EthD domain-containing protein [Croceicoccus sp.]